MGTLKLEAGKFYKTLDGRKAFVAAVVLDNPFRGHLPYSEFMVFGFIDGADNYMWWDAKGNELDRLARDSLAFAMEEVAS